MEDDQIERCKAYLRALGGKSAVVWVGHWIEERPWGEAEGLSFSPAARLCSRKLTLRLLPQRQGAQAFGRPGRRAIRGCMILEHLIPPSSHLSGEPSRV